MPPPRRKAKSPSKSAPSSEPTGNTEPAQKASAAERAGSRGGWLAAGWQRLREFCAVGGTATYVWPRWLVLRALGFIYLFVFSGIIVESAAIIGPRGVAPIGPYLAEIKAHSANALAAFFTAPTLFWLGNSGTTIAFLEWTGLLAAICLVLNIWPRAAVATCWVIFLSFMATWTDFNAAQLDRLVLEAALLCIPFAPGGFRPGLGAHAPPRPIAVFALRWLLLRVMGESGWVKLVTHDPHWRNLTAMDVMYETAPSPTIMGYWAHHLPHAFHVAEIAFTFVAELLAPVVAVFGGRRGRWFAFVVWTAFQVGIQVTCNFGWLNVAAIGFGLLLLDDQMIASVSRRWKRGPLIRFSVEPATPPGFRPAPTPVTPWKLHGLRVALGLQLALTLFYVPGANGFWLEQAPSWLASMVRPLAAFGSANGYFLYASFDPAHWQVDFEGSNDGGKTWRTYEYRHLPQKPERIAPFLAPWFPRFEATIQIQSWHPQAYSVLPLIAKELLARNADVLARFARDPFPDRNPTLVRMRRYRLSFTSLETHSRTGRYWWKEFDRDAFPAKQLTVAGAVVDVGTSEIIAALKSGNFAAARGVAERQYAGGNLEAGFMLADFFMRGMGGPVQVSRAVGMFSELAERGEVGALYNLGLCYENGVGVAVDYGRAVVLYRQAIAGGSPLSLWALGTLLTDGRVQPRNDVEGLSCFLLASDPTRSSALPERLRRELPLKISELTKRMSPQDVAQARAR